MYLSKAPTSLIFSRYLLSSALPRVARALSTSMKAVVIQASKKAELVSDRPLPKLRPDYVKVKTVAVALNPTDWKHVYFFASKGALVGCDYSGVVEEVGDKVDTKWKVGDRICGFAHGGNAVQHEDGAFAEYIVVKGDIQMHIPESLSFEEAATLGVGISTVGQALYQSLKIPLPSHPTKEAFPILIYGGSTATGTLAIQFAKLSGLSVIATASPHNFSLCKKLGADAVFDYNDPDCAEKIKEFSNDIRYAFDTIANESTGAICTAALASNSAVPLLYSSLLPVKRLPREGVENKYTLAYTMVGEAFRMGPDEPQFPASKEDLEIGKTFSSLAEKLLAEKKIRVHPIDKRTDGLKGVLEGMDDLREGKVSGKKLVYRIDETP
ncbi:hypothetical protein MMC13_002783 [Lambiella insularis]|nr:hypothetical protein [Lambiella insularis]